MPKYDVICIGAGSAGMVVAQSAQAIGIKVAVIERDRIGGDCLWTGCVPSKSLIAAAKAAWTVRTAAEFGINVRDYEIDTQAIWNRIRAVQNQIAEEDDNAEKFKELGTDVYFGAGRITGPHSVDVDGKTLESEFILVATGSRAAHPPISGLEEAGFLTSENVFTLEKAPESLVVIGGGPIGTEIAQSMNRLGKKVTLLQSRERILERDEPELVDILMDRLRAEGVDLVTGVNIDSVEIEGGQKKVSGTVAGQQQTWTAEQILVSAGRRPNVEGLGLEEVGIETNKRGVVVDKRLRTSVPSVYAAGDVAGRYLFTHSAAFEAVRALRNMFYAYWKKAPDLIPWATFTDPELAHVGMTSAEARRKFGEEKVQVWRQPLSHSDRARAEGETDGMFLIVTGPGKKIVGAHILSPAAGELIGEYTLAISEGKTLSPSLANMIHVYPTFSSSNLQLASEATNDNLDSGVNKLARRLSWVG
jgi:pyruvate/2-oxoglutarate dehydrogenase complex dihydrolipoamide dehydrogenase (E3) component